MPLKTTKPANSLRTGWIEIDMSEENNPVKGCGAIRTPIFTVKCRVFCTFALEG